ncbi:uncharacterized protein LOC113562942 [Ooceraea biroi]|nr:uncharacterized protein LOC113562942 [Ooceraea biroi]
MSNVTCIGNPEEKYVATIDKIRDTIRKLEASLKCSRELEAARFLRYSTLKSREKILTDDLKKAKIRDEHMLSEQSKINLSLTHFAGNLVERSHFSDLFRQSVTDIQLDSVNILPETLKRRVQRTWHQK